MSDAARHILLVEDDAIIGLMLEAMVADLGFTPLGPAADVHQALALLAEGPLPEAALLDHDLAGASSEPVARRLEELAIPYAWASGHRIESAVPCLHKPYVLADVEAVLKALIGPGAAPDLSARAAAAP